MSEKYTQLSLEQRYQIGALISIGVSQRLVAEQVGVHPSTISRELKRNVAKRGRTAGLYNALNAQSKTNERHRSKPKRIIFTEQMKLVVVSQLKVEKWSPEIISVEGNRSGACPVSHERIYQWIWECKHTTKRKNKAYKKLYECLKHGRRRRKRGNSKDSRGTIPNRVPIENRPAIVAKRKRLGDMEIDLMMGKNHQGALLVMTDRASLYTSIRKLKSKSSKEVSKAIIESLGKYKHPLHTLTFDNDKAFTDHQIIGNRLKAATYFTRPYTSQDKGTVENRIGVIRRFFTKKTDLHKITHQQVRSVQQKLNNRPIRKFKYSTANQMLQQKIALIS